MIFKQSAMAAVLRLKRMRKVFTGKRENIRRPGLLMGCFYILKPGAIIREI